MANKSELVKPDKLQVVYLLREAKKEIQAADQIQAKADEATSPHYRAAVEQIAEAKKAISQAEIARRIGYSEPWVSQLLRWAKNGYRDSPFGPQSMAARTKKKDSLGAPKDDQKKSVDVDEDAEAEPESADNDTIADNNTDSDTDNDTDDEVSGDAIIASKDRERLIKLLGLLGSDKDGECVSAARKVEKLRKKLNMVWDDLIIPSEKS